MRGEESLVLEAWSRVRACHPRSLLILAPRHPQRVEEVAQILTAAQRSFIRRTTLATQEGALADQLLAPEVVLLDTLGELGGILELAEVVFVGGSLVPTGGHNLLEPAWWSRPIVFGPHMENFQDMARVFLQAKAAVQVQDARELAEVTLQLFGDNWARAQLGARAKQILERESGATGRVLDQIRPLLETEAPLRTEN
jgi:3-deoxy-D-manno-octulosonic-acid transferase